MRGVESVYLGNLQGKESRDTSERNEALIGEMNCTNSQVRLLMFVGYRFLCEQEYIHGTRRGGDAKRVSMAMMAPLLDP